MSQTDTQKILLVDDSPAMLVIVRRYIEQFPTSVNIIFQTADNGKTALDIIRVWEPDLVISDLHMPIMDGIELLEALKREMLGIKIGLVTAELDEKQLQKAKDAGALFVLQTPFKAKELHESIEPFMHLEEVPTTDNVNAPERLDIQAENIVVPSIDVVRTMINQIAKRPITVQKATSMSFQNNRFPYVLGLLGNKDESSVLAMALGDSHASCLLGLASGHLPELQTRSVLAQNKLPGNVLKGNHILLGHLASSLYNTEKKSGLQLHKINQLRKHKPELNKILTNSDNKRLDVSLCIPGQPIGYLTLLAAS